MERYIVLRMLAVSAKGTYSKAIALRADRDTVIRLGEECTQAYRELNECHRTLSDVERMLVN